MQGGNFVVLKSALDAADAFNPKFNFYGEDTELARRLSKVGSVKFSFDLPAFSSGRRLTAEGLFRVAFQYSVNYLWTVLFKRPFTLTWLDFRHPTGVDDTVSARRGDAGSRRPAGALTAARHRRPQHNRRRVGAGVARRRAIHYDQPI